MSNKLENFERAFSGHTAGITRICACGKKYYVLNECEDWNKGEFEALQKETNTKGLEYWPGAVCFEGTEYVDACDCWHPRAKQIIGFIDGHAHAIADYLRLEKERKQREADQSPTVEL